MPLVVFAIGAYVAGLAAGFSQVPLLALAVVGAAIAAGYTKGLAAAAAFGAIAASGVFAAHGVQRADSECARTLKTSPLIVTLDDSVAPGAYARAHLRDCEASVAISVSGGAAPAGAIARVEGTLAETDHGVMMQHAVVTPLAHPDLLHRWRTTAGGAIDRTFGEDAPLVRALLIADRRELPPEVRDRFASAGLAHILAIAGLHIGIIMTAVELAFELAGVPRRRATILTIALIVLYVAIIGAPVPAVRSATMLTAGLVTRLAQRPTSRWAIVALGASQPIMDPRVVLDAGYQLSVVGVTAMIVAHRLATRLGVRRQHWLLESVSLTLLGTTIATIATAPIVACVFGRVSIVAPLSNLAATPLIALAQPMLFCGMLLSPIHPLASLVADAAHPLLRGLDGVATVAGGFSWSSIPVAPTVFAAVVASVMSGAVIVACASRDWQRPALIASAAAALLVWLPVVPQISRMTELHMIDVGQGDAIALRTPHGHWILFDAGRAWRGGDAGRSTVVPYLGRRGGVLDVFVLSHPHTDHVGGAATVLRALHPSRYIDAGFPGPAESYRASLEAARSVGVRWMRAHPGDSLAVDGVSLMFLAPDSAWTASLDDPNLASVVTLVRVGDVRMLLMGDAERPEEDWLLAHERGMLRADILKVGHHGSKTSSSPEFLDAVQPRLALVSVGAGNTYHLPTPAVMRTLAGRGAQVLRTDRLGTIVARTDGHQILIAADGDTWALPPSSPPRGTP